MCTVHHGTMDPSREWTCNRIEEKYLSKVFMEKVNEFIKFACEQEEFQRWHKLKMPLHQVPQYSIP